MSKDDYHVIVYQVLSYMYACLKAGDDPKDKELAAIALKAELNERYWHYILKSLVDYGLVQGCTVVEADNSFPRVLGMDHAAITPTGIEYLTDNAFIAKAKRFLKDAKDIMPFI